MDSNIKQLVEVSQQYGKNKAFVIAGGGNTSYKDNDYIWVKASGVALETIDENGFVTLSREKLKVVSSKTYSSNSTEREVEVKADLANAIVSTNGNRPSVETSMHEIIDYAFVVHTHPTKVNAVMCSKNSAKNCLELFGSDVLFIPYTDPGYVLFKKVESEIQAYFDLFGKAPQVIFLENHGVFVAANSVAEIDAIYTDLMQKIENRIAVALPSDEAKAISSPLIQEVALLNSAFDGFIAKGVSSDLILYFAKSRESFEQASTAFTPDDIVYCKAYYLFIPQANDSKALESLAQEKIADFKLQNGYFPKVLVLENQGVIAIEDSEKSASNVLEVFTNILKISFLSNNFGGPQFMTKSQIEFIDNWEVENYRRQMAKKA
ncbi:MAG: class II aldolase/adducin family protein [Bacteroidales bacterium]